MPLPKFSPLIKAVFWKSNGMRLPITLDELVFTPLHQSKFSHCSTVLRFVGNQKSHEAWSGVRGG